jgi:hypothetical protein
VAGLGLDVSLPYFRRLEDAVTPSLRDLEEKVRTRWHGLKSAVERTQHDYEVHGITGDSVLIGIHSFTPAPDSDAEGEPAGEELEGSVTNPKEDVPARRSGRPVKKSEKTRDSVSTKVDKGKRVQGLKDKSSGKFLSFTEGKHTDWDAPVRIPIP